MKATLSYYPKTLLTALHITGSAFTGLTLTQSYGLLKYENWMSPFRKSSHIYNVLTQLIIAFICCTWFLDGRTLLVITPGVYLVS